MYKLTYIPDSFPGVFKRNISCCEGGPSPKMLVVNTEIETSQSGEHGGEISPNVWQHTPFSEHEEDGIVAEPQIHPEEASA